ncbi:MAG: hypothetical protein ACPL5I_06420 [Thermodesulfobacteriota bacterium]
MLVPAVLCGKQVGKREIVISQPILISPRLPPPEASQGHIKVFAKTDQRSARGEQELMLT